MSDPAGPLSPRKRLLWTALYAGFGGLLIASGFYTGEWGIAVVGVAYGATSPWIVRQIINVRILSLLAALGLAWFAAGLHQEDTVRTIPGLLLALMAIGSILYQQRGK